MQYTIEEYMYSLKNLWLRIEQLDTELPVLLEKEIQNFVKTLNLIPLVFKKRIQSFERLTINRKVITTNTRIYNTDFLSYPPEKKVQSYGRCNLISQSVLYGTFSTPTAIDELNPNVGDIVTISKWEEKISNIGINVYPVFRNEINEPKKLNLKNEYLKYLSCFTINVQKLIDVQQEFINSCFTKHINYNRNYIFSANIANKILHDIAGSSIDAIIYPSVKDPLKTDNIALKKESVHSNYMITQVREYILKVNEKNIKSLEIIDQTNRIEHKKIIWH